VWPFTGEWVAYVQETRKDSQCYVQPMDLDEPIEGFELEKAFWPRMIRQAAEADLRYGRDGVPASALPESPIGRSTWISIAGEAAQDAAMDYAKGYAYVASVLWHNFFQARWPSKDSKRMRSLAQSAVDEVCSIPERGTLLRYIIDGSFVLNLDFTGDFAAIRCGAPSSMGYSQNFDAMPVERS
ncbi:MAG: hypothetical protein ACYCW6_31340, partial [Candidatus Xenobia bacterium]